MSHGLRVSMQATRELFACGICWQHMGSRIRMCANQHSVCDSCSARAPRCGMCRGDVTLDNRLLMMIRDECRISCPCGAEVPGAEYASHIDKCTEHVCCPICSNHHGVTGMKDHVRDKHDGHVIAATDSIFAFVASVTMNALVGDSVVVVRIGPLAVSPSAPPCADATRLEEGQWSVSLFPLRSCTCSFSVSVQDGSFSRAGKLRLSDAWEHRGDGLATGSTLRVSTRFDDARCLR